ncbi:rhodanese-like domain-containing protein [Mangrovitalea sediminis]|uniref:rhodanese-like domain-containing protein n=1 Tax=Mangrovitalea sediminis TaxID=1982043 RepID=UPI000BE5D4D1|nr:rhodanese-like domain-containing protein [Mangrovitalea sediminis]
MERLFEFAVNHWILVVIFAALLAALMLLESFRAGRKISPNEAVSLINKDQMVVVDLRERKDFTAGHITGSLHIPLANLQERISELKKHEGQQILLVCRTGQSAGAAVKMLNKAGFKNAVRLRGGVEEWRGSNLPLIRK